MNLTIMPRQTGKTKKLLEKSALNGETIVCSNPKMIKYLKEMALAHQLVIPEPITYSDLLGNTFRGKRIKGFMIDDLDWFLQYIGAGTPITEMTATYINIINGGI